MRTQHLTLLLCLGASHLAAQDSRAPGLHDAVAEGFARALPPASEALWTQIPWRRSLTAALAEARSQDKPVYLFVNDGDVGDGRC